MQDDSWTWSSSNAYQNTDDPEYHSNSDAYTFTEDLDHVQNSNAYQMTDDHDDMGAGSERQRPTLTVPPRRTLTDYEDSAIGKLVDSLDKQETAFSFGGVADCSAGRLLYCTAVGEARVLDFGKEASVAAAFEAAEVSPHGHGGGTVYNEAVRKAREIKSERLYLPHPIYTLATSPSSSILASIASTTALGHVRTQLDKVNIYAEGGFFTTHRDTPKGNDHIGTLLIALPFAYEGGVLSVRHDDREVKHDWHESSAGKLHWSFLFADTLHEVLPVTFGHRVTLSFHVFANAETGPPALESAALDVSSAPFLQDLKKLLADGTFLSEGGKMAIALSHKYPVAEAATDSFSGLFKGSDRLLIQALREAGVPFEIVAIYKPEDGESESPSKDSDGWPKDARISWMKYQRESYWSDSVVEEEGAIRVSSKLHGLYPEGFTSGGQYEDMEDLWKTRKMVLDKSLIWVRYPVEETYSDGLPYIAYGNEACTNHRYVTVGVVATVPPFADRVKADV